jgi:integrase
MQTNRQRLTLPRINAFSCQTGKGQDFLWDSDVPRLGVRATEAGAKTFIFGGKLAGKSMRITIGSVGDSTIENARAEARRLQTLIDRGEDPRVAKAEKIAKEQTKRGEMERQEVTMAEAWVVYVESRKHQWSPRHLTDHINLSAMGGDLAKKGNRKKTPGALAPLMPLKLVEINAERVKAWLRDESARRPAQARLAFGALRGFLNWCGDTPSYAGIAHREACDSRIARQNLPKKQAKRDVLQREQLPAWFDAVRSLDNPVISAYLQALLLTGARREELAGLTWENLDFRWQSMTIRDKVEGERTIPLTPYVSQLLAVLPRRNEWVFSSPAAASGRLQEPRIPHNRALTKAGIEELSLHGLRRSFGSLAEWVECPAGIAAQIMGHKPSATAEKHYRVRPLDLLRQWHSKIEAWILEQAGVAFDPAQAVPGLRVVKVA